MPCLGTQSGAALLLLCHLFFSEHCRAERVRRAQTRSIKPYGETKPAPDIGKTPFIRPHEIPEDQNAK